MRDKIKEITNLKQFHVCMIGTIIFIILFITGVMALKYNVEGETNLPFDLTKVSIISNVEGIDNTEDTQNKWNLKVNQNNDIYLYIKKNDNYKETEIIDSIKLDNFKIEESPKVGQLKLYKPDNSVETNIFINKEENEVDSIEYEGNLDANIKDLKIANQGGLVIFRFANCGIGDYISNDDEEIKHSELLKKLSVNNEDLKFKISFDMYINLNSKKSYKANIKLELPVKDVVDNGVQNEEITDFDNVIFKRV